MNEDGYYTEDADLEFAKEPTPEITPEVEYIPGSYTGEYEKLWLRADYDPMKYH